MKKIIFVLVMIGFFIWIATVGLNLNPFLDLIGIRWKMASMNSIFFDVKNQQPKFVGHIKAVAYPEKDQVIDKSSFYENKNMKDAFINFKSLSKKVLRSTEEEILFKRDLADLKLIKTSLDILEAKNEVDFNHSFEQKRMTVVEYFSAALDWKQNPQRQIIINELSKLTYKFALDGKLSERQRKSLLADKMELISILNKNQPGRAKKIIESKRGTIVGKYYSLAVNLYQ